MTIVEREDIPGRDPKGLYFAQSEDHPGRGPVL